MAKKMTEVDKIVRKALRQVKVTLENCEYDIYWLYEMAEKVEKTNKMIESKPHLHWPSTKKQGEELLEQIEEALDYMEKNDFYTSDEEYQNLINS